MNPALIIILGALITIIGVLGLLLRKNLVVMLMATELIMLGGVLGLLGGARLHAPQLLGVPDGALFVPFILVVAAAEVCVGLTLIMVLFKTQRTLWVDEMDKS